MTLINRVDARKRLYDALVALYGSSDEEVYTEAIAATKDENISVICDTLTDIDTERLGPLLIKFAEGFDDGEQIGKRLSGFADPCISGGELAYLLEGALLTLFLHEDTDKLKEYLSFAERAKQTEFIKRYKDSKNLFLNLVEIVEVTGNVSNMEKLLQVVNPEACGLPRPTYDYEVEDIVRKLVSTSKKVRDALNTTEWQVAPKIGFDALADIALAAKDIGNYACVILENIEQLAGKLFNKTHVVAYAKVLSQEDVIKAVENDMCLADLMFPSLSKVYLNTVEQQHSSGSLYTESLYGQFEELAGKTGKTLCAYAAAHHKKRKEIAAKILEELEFISLPRDFGALMTPDERLRRCNQYLESLEHSAPVYARASAFMLKRIIWYHAVCQVKEK